MEEEFQILRADFTNLAKLVIDWQMLFFVEKFVVMDIGAKNNVYA